ncbi:MAG TPA: type II secretion system protein [Terriglobia bacterium]|jgi:prepilin-type N-terminal cleavage/methylation domain-containing protein
MNKRNGFSLLELLLVVAIILIIATIAIPSLLRSRQSANETHAVANMRTLNTAEVQYLSNSQGQYGNIVSLVSAGLLDLQYSQPTSGYIFNVQVTPDNLNYTATATAAGYNGGRYDYYSGPDYVVRFSTDPSRAPTGYSGAPVQ